MSRRRCVRFPEADGQGKGNSRSGLSIGGAHRSPLNPRHDLAAFARRAGERAIADLSRPRADAGGGPAFAIACGARLDAAWALLPVFRDAAAFYNTEARAVDFGN